MGRVTTAVKVESVEDLFEVHRGLRTTDQVRSAEVTDALVDTGATMLSLPKQMIVDLGLRHVRNRTARTPAGVQEFRIFSPVQLTVQGRTCTIEAAEIPDECPVLIGQLPLEILDWMVDAVRQRLVGNPAHGGEQMMDMFHAEVRD